MLLTRGTTVSTHKKCYDVINQLQDSFDEPALTLDWDINRHISQLHGYLRALPILSAKFGDFWYSGSAGRKSAFSNFPLTFVRLSAIEFPFS